jgi:CubicO group peptidase (beta-lactamase class C family)
MHGVFPKLVAVAACAVTVLLAHSAPLRAAPPRPPPDPAVIDRYLTDALAATGLPGMAVAITHGSDVVHLAALGSDGRGEPVTPSTQFRVASLSKSFTAAGVLQLAASGRVDLDAPVRSYLPSFALADARSSARITVRHLLNQTSGIADVGFPAVTAREQNLERRVASLGTAQSASEPDTEFHYSDPNYQVLARLIEVVTGTSWARYLRDNIFAPLGMANTVATATAAEAGQVAPDLATGHVLVFGRPIARAELDGLVAGSTGVVSTAEDMARWLVAQSTGGGSVLTPDAVALMQTPPPGVAGGYAMGWQTVTPESGPRRLEHTGVLSTFWSAQVLLPDSGYGFAVLLNGNSTMADTAGLTAGLAALLAADGEESAPRSTALVSTLIGGACVLVLVLRVRSLVRIEHWRRRRAGRPWWTTLPGILWLLLPVGLLIGLVPLVGAAAGRVFTFWQLCLAMPDVVVLLVVAAITGATLAITRLVALAAARRGREGP